ncbi:hypothetical protein [Halothermothrix orenii]|uniref:Uncharacterized protein n=1 Tax=Halothermothrix orenii (strain H 168 / OCM 544 / DSM 9562) TaxID=373903 RepID=B8D1P0_HALOH|nr:hypothetical protein [Halothermothrix orenii]ACL69117.1 hypothetical protein Hore_03560 [Halothermothrix orenii H 168]
MIDKNIKDITLQDIVNLNIYDDVNFDEYINVIRKEKPGAKDELLKLLDRGNQVIKKSFIEEELQKLKKEHNQINPDFNLVTTDYFKGQIESLMVLASRTVEPGPEEVQSKKNGWYFRGYITLGELKELPSIYPYFKKAYSEYNRDEWELELNVVGGIIQGYPAVDEETINSWRDEGVLMELWGFDKGNKMTSLTDIMVNSLLKLKKQAQKIREKGKPDNLHEARILKLDNEGKKLFSHIFY